jgi:hypothetical protein
MKKNLAFIFILAATLGFAAHASAQVAPTAPDPEMAAVFAEQTLPQVDMIPKPVLTCGPICFTALHLTTATISGSGPDCTSAQNSLNSQLQSIAKAHCVNDLGYLNSCNVVIHNTTTCTLIATGTWQVQGYATYSCKDTTC